MVFLKKDSRKMIGVVKGVENIYIEPDLYVYYDYATSKIVLSLGQCLDFEPRFPLGESEVLALTNSLKKTSVESFRDDKKHTFEIKRNQETILEYNLTLNDEGVGNMDLDFFENGEYERSFSLGWGGYLLLIDYLQNPFDNIKAYESKGSLYPKVPSGSELLWDVSRLIAIGLFLFSLTFTPIIGAGISIGLGIAGALAVSNLILFSRKKNIELDLLAEQKRILEKDVRCIRYSANFYHKKILKPLVAEGK